MTYIVFNQTSHGAGIYFYGLTRSRSTAQKLVDAMDAMYRPGDGNGVAYATVENIDKYEFDSLVQHLKRKGEL